MSSANINIGFSNDRNSSRVLKPPGGSHTDIFGVGDLQTHPKPQSDDKEVTAVNAIETEGQKEDVTGKNSKENEEKPKETESSTNRPRVPPGGFSSGLW